MKGIASLIWLLFGTTLHAEQLTVGDKFREVQPIAFVHAFLGTCAQNPGRLDKVGAAATALGWAETPEPLRTLLSPQATNAPFQSWFVIEGEGAPVLVGISEGSFKGQTYQFCAVSNPFMDSETALKKLATYVELNTPDSDETVAGQRTRLWLTPSILDGSFLQVSDIGGMGYKGVTLSIAAPKQY